MSPKKFCTAGETRGAVETTRCEGVPKLLHVSVTILENVRVEHPPLPFLVESVWNPHGMRSIPMICFFFFSLFFPFVFGIVDVLDDKDARAWDGLVRTNSSIASARVVSSLCRSLVSVYKSYREIGSESRVSFWIRSRSVQFSGNKRPQKDKKRSKGKGKVLD